MVLKRYTIALFFIPILLVLATSSAKADRLVLKDGSVEESDRIWESEKYVHFILKGTRAVEIRYAKDIVARIERQNKSGQISTSEPVEIQSNEGEAHSPKAPSEQTLKQDIEMKSTATPVQRTQPAHSMQLDRTLIEKNRHIGFYDPHRPQRYWADRDSRYNTLTAAIDALAKQYGKPASWIEANLGEENDLGVIHERLIKAIENEAAAKSAEHPSPAATEEPTFYDDERSVPYQTKADRFFNTREEAIHDLARQYHQSSEWIEKNMGKDNRLPVIHDNLARGEMPKSNALGASADTPSLKPLPAIPHGVHFYDPRRSEKYWSNLNSYHSTLQDALKALANEYDVTPAWIESHMGNTNDLYQIHQNIRKSLKNNSTDPKFE